MNVQLRMIDGEEVVVFRPVEHSKENAKAIKQELINLGIGDVFRIRFKLGALQVRKGNHWVLIGDEKAYLLNGRTLRGGISAWDSSTESVQLVAGLPNKNFTKALR